MNKGEAGLEDDAIAGMARELNKAKRPLESKFFRVGS
jgi:hypothetical protein